MLVSNVAIFLRLDPTAKYRKVCDKWSHFRNFSPHEKLLCCMCVALNPDFCNIKTPRYRNTSLNLEIDSGLDSLPRDPWNISFTVGTVRLSGTLLTSPLWLQRVRIMVRTWRDSCWQQATSRSRDATCLSFMHVRQPLSRQVQPSGWKEFQKGCHNEEFRTVSIRGSHVWSALFSLNIYIKRKSIADWILLRLAELYLK
jgi:hypothetical protein